MYFKVMEKMIEYFGNDVKRINHALKVFSFASLIAEKEIGSDIFLKNVVYFAGLLHDIGIKEAERKYNSNAGKYQEIEGPEIAENILREFYISDDIISRVSFIIGNHHSYDRIDGVDFQILVEADFLVNIFEDGMQLNAIEGVREKIFKTETGKKLLETMFLKNIKN
ncbi:MAG: HD domain-containing protein [Brevinematia bacterium]